MAKCSAVVTGASSGVGLAASRALASRGCDLVIAARDAARLSSVAGELSSKFNVRVRAVQADLTREDDVRRLISAAYSEFEDINVVFMSYGNPRCEPCEPLDASWDDLVDAFKMYVASSMLIMGGVASRNRSRATVILTSSFSSRAPMWPTGVSDVIRASLPALAKLVSRRYPEKLRVLVLELGSFRTPGAERLIGRLAEAEGLQAERYWQEKVASLSPLRRLGSEEELEELISWLAFSPDYLTGAVIEFDGASTPCV